MLTRTKEREREELVAQLAAAREEVAELRSELSRLASRDRIAGSLLSLSALRSHLDLDIRSAQRHGQPVSVAVIDLDGFRALNARHGYSWGDEALAAVGAAITSRTRSRDLACRIGSDEFAVVLDDTPAEGAVIAMERVIRDLEELRVGPVTGLSASVGIAQLERGQSVDDLLAAGGVALGQARLAGGSRVTTLAAAEPAAGARREDGVVEALAEALEQRDRYTGEHSESVVDLVIRVAAGLGLSPDEVEQVRIAALLHDIGKIGIPDEILHKPGPLDDEEWVVMRRHPEIGETILRAIPGMGAVARIVRHEHERWDGAGYPDGISGTDIPIGSRIILACDAYHAMVSDRPYRQAMPHTEAMAELTRNAGRQFDPDVVEALVGHLYGLRQAGLAPA